LHFALTFYQVVGAFAGIVGTLGLILSWVIRKDFKHGICISLAKQSL